MPTVDLRCPRQLHGRGEDDTLIVLCRQCSKDQGKPIYHEWDKRTWQRLDADDHDDLNERDQEAA